MEPESKYGQLRQLASARKAGFIPHPPRSLVDLLTSVTPRYPLTLAYYTACRQRYIIPHEEDEKENLMVVTPAVDHSVFAHRSPILCGPSTIHPQFPELQYISGLEATGNSSLIALRRGGLPPGRDSRSRLHCLAAALALARVLPVPRMHQHGRRLHQPHRDQLGLRLLLGLLLAWVASQAVDVG